MVPCFRGGDRRVLCDAREEAQAVVLLDACSGVEFQVQPARILFSLAGEKEHYPDLLVVDGMTKEFWECKRDAEVLDLFVRKRTELLRELLAPLGFGYRVVTTSQLTSGNYLENADSMRRRAKLPVSRATQRHIRDHMADFIPARASQVLGGISIRDQFDILCSLLYSGDVAGHLREKISLEMTIQPARLRGVKPWVWQLFETTS